MSVTHRLTRYASGALDGHTTCSVYEGEEWRVEWLTMLGRRSRARRIDPANRLGRCTGCGHWLTDADLAAAGVTADG